MKPSQTLRPELSFDGCGINGPDEYRSRIATFARGADVKRYGPLLAAAPDLLAALRETLSYLDLKASQFESEYPENHAIRISCDRQRESIRAAIAKATGSN